MATTQYPAKLTVGILTFEQAHAISPEYVAFSEGDFDQFDHVQSAFDTLQRGQVVLTCYENQFVRAKVTSINRDDFRAVDGPVVRVSNGEYSWRVDGAGYAFPIK